MIAKSTPPNAVEIFHPQPDTLYPLDTTARLAGVERRTVLVYCRHGMIRPVVGDEDESWKFSEETVRVIRRIEGLRESHGINLAGIRMIIDLMNRVDELEREVRFLRELR